MGRTGSSRVKGEGTATREGRTDRAGRGLSDGATIVTGTMVFRKNASDIGRREGGSEVGGREES